MDALYTRKQFCQYHTSASFVWCPFLTTISPSNFYFLHLLSPPPQPFYLLWCNFLWKFNFKHLTSTRRGKCTNNIYISYLVIFQSWGKVTSSRALNPFYKLGLAGRSQTSCFPSLQPMGISMGERNRAGYLPQGTASQPFSFHSHQYLGTLGNPKQFPMGKRLGGPETVLCALLLKQEISWTSPFF